MFKVYYNEHQRIGYDFYADIAERIVEKRKEAGFTQAQLAKKAGVSVGEIARYEEVKIRCREEVLQKISNALGVSLDWLIGAEYDDPDCKECLYTVGAERSDFRLYFKATSPQSAFLKAYEWSIKVKIIWFEPRDRASVKLVGVPVREADYKGKFRERKDGHADDINCEKE